MNNIYSMYYHIDDLKITIFPFRALPKLLALIFIAPLALGALVIVPMILSLPPEKRVLVHAPWQSPILFILFGFIGISCLFGFIHSRHEIIFDKLRQTIYRKTLWGTKPILSFKEVGNIALVYQNGFGVGYKMTGKQDQYGKGFLISPAIMLSWESRRIRKEYMEKVLPPLKAILSTATPSSDINPHRGRYEAGMFTFYRSHPLGYELTLKDRWWIVALIIWLVLAATIWYVSLTHGFNSSDDIVLIFAPLPGLPVILSRLTKKVILDTQERAVKLFYFGRIFRKELLADFVRFNIVRNHLNGLYNGTEVKMQFKNKEIVLANFWKTAKIDEFLEETRFIIQEKNTFPVQKSTAAE